MVVKSFKDLIAWQKAHQLCLGIYKTFKTCKDWNFKDQIQRASVSVMDNIAEGYARKSDKTLHHYLMMSRGSVAEVESLLILAVGLNYISKQQQERLILQTEDVAKLISAFARKLTATS